MEYYLGIIIAWIGVATMVWALQKKKKRMTQKEIDKLINKRGQR